MGVLRARLAAAVAAIDRGWPVIPLRPFGKVPALKDWDRRATLDPDQVLAWWEHRPYNIGISCRAAGLLVVDLDQGVPHGRDVLADLARAHGADDPRDTYTVATPSGGEHRYFRAPDTPLRNTAGKLGRHVDTRAAGGYVAAQGSIRRTMSGLRLYKVVRDLPVAPAPDWLVARLSPPVPEPRTGPGTGLRAEPADPPAPRRVRAYRAAVVDGETGRVRSALPGTRAHVLFTAACRLGELVGAGFLDEHAARDVLLDAAAGHVGVDGWTEREAAHHVGNGIAAGRRRPRVIPERRSPDDVVFVPRQR
ncbi:bifunctional DNA primase/polymerase [Actinosynnema sp. NPDC047251]|uniref:Bifunctional DNA primase/polymerase n=1 Tax=Saccharothrix espanaensis (strain ATCC 51144 / DSM 44229 / JCM 9112 / NBRC 15066 / NRRL 15764) TaxID=1179773 RepID=K0K1H4_SACES|nr:bifunctional DNA primase/polymerase [Saccharothrix espanaensis]CCH30709.1 Bifunctional DNA primase/polymerase [Saccharothrix espanaensis DSM 44229]